MRNITIVSQDGNTTITVHHLISVEDKAVIIDGVVVGLYGTGERAKAVYDELQMFRDGNAYRDIIYHGKKLKDLSALDILVSFDEKISQIKTARIKLEESPKKWRSYFFESMIERCESDIKWENELFRKAIGWLDRKKFVETYATNAERFLMPKE